MDFRPAMEGGKEEISSALNEGPSPVMPVPAAMVPACKKCRRENIQPPWLTVKT
jgi:hypothetical protein